MLETRLTEMEGRGSPFCLAKRGSRPISDVKGKFKAQRHVAFAPEAPPFAPVLQHVACHPPTSDSISSYLERSALTFPTSGSGHSNFNTSDLIERKSCWWSEPCQETGVHLVTQTWFLRSLLVKCVQFSETFLIFCRHVGLMARLDPQSFFLV